MYELREDCGTANEYYKFITLKEVIDWMQENHEEHYEGATEELIRTGSVNCGIDFITLEEVFETFEISEGTLLRRKNEKTPDYYECVKGVSIDEHGNTEVNTQDCWFYQGRLCYDYECYGESSVKEIYKFYELVGEDFKLFE